MANTYVLIASNTLGASAASVTFSSIPSTYTDLVIKFMVRTNSSGFTNDQMRMRFNGVTTSSYSYTYLRGDGASVASYSPGTTETSSYIALVNASNATSNTFSNGEIYIPNYTLNNQKQNSSFVAMEDNTTTAYLTATANLGTATTAISSITFLSASAASFISGSSFYLYGIKNS